MTGVPGVMGAAVPQVRFVGEGAAGTIWTSSATVVPAEVAT